MTPNVRLISRLSILLACGPLVAHGSAVPSDASHGGRYYEARWLPDHAGRPGPLEFRFRYLQHRAPWCTCLLKLDRPVDLASGARLVLHVPLIEADRAVVLKVEIRDADSADAVQRSAFRRVRLPPGRSRVVTIHPPRPLDGLVPAGRQRVVLWPDFSRIQYIGVTVEARHNDVTEGMVQLGPIAELVEGRDRVAVPIVQTSTRFFEHQPAGPSSSEVADGTREAPRAATAAAPQRLEPIEQIRRDDPLSALFPSGAGFKLEPFYPLGIAARLIVREEPHRIDGLLIEATRHDATTSDELRRFVSDPVLVRSGLASVILETPNEPGWPRLTYTYEHVDVQSDAPIRLDFQQQIHEVKALWTSPCLGDDGRWRLSLEPAYQAWRVTGEGGFAREDKHRGFLNAVLHDEYGQREFFLQALASHGDHSDAHVDETEQIYRLEWRQWHGADRTAFSTIGAAYQEVHFDPMTGFPKDRIRDLEVFGNLIIELDAQGRWRWFNQLSAHRKDVDVFIGGAVGSTNRVFDYFLAESRITHEILTNLDLSLGLEHTAADSHAFDSLGVVARASLFEFGPFRADVGVRDTWYYHLNDDLWTVFMEVNFAR